MNKIRVLLADDHPLVREGLRAMLATSPDIEVVAEAADGAEAVKKASEHRPDIVLMDLRMPGLDGLEATRRIKSQFDAIFVVLLTVYDNDAYIVEAIKAGADGYLLKDASKDLILHTIRAVNSGGMLIKTSLLREAILSLVKLSAQPPKERGSAGPNELTPRELDVLRLIVQGGSNKDIGRALHLSEDTAKKHVQAILSKLGVSDRTQAAVKAVCTGLVDPRRELQ